MLVDDSRTREALSKIVYRLSSDPVVREDLMQEALIHLWLLEERRPAQTRSWYLQSCKFHLQNHLNTGRSVDSPKRNAGRMAVGLDHEEYEMFVLQYNGADEFFEKLGARDILSLLTNRLTPFEQQILQLLAEGMGAREIAQRLNVTHPTILKYRRKIAVHAIRLGIPPVLRYARAASLAAAS